MTNTTAESFAIHTSCSKCGLDVEVWSDAPQTGYDRGSSIHCSHGLMHDPIIDMDTVRAEQYAAVKAATISKFVTAPFKVSEVTTEIELELAEDAKLSFEDGVVRRITVKVTRFPNGDVAGGNEPYVRAEAFVVPNDRRRSPFWSHLPSEVAQQLAVHGLF